MLWKIILVIGILGVLLGLLITGVSVALPIVSSHTSWDEAMLGIIPGILVLIVSFFIAVLGMIFVIKNRRKLPLAQ